MVAFEWILASPVLWVMRNVLVVRPPEHSKMLGDGRLGYTRVASQCVDGLFTLTGKHLENGPACGVRKSMKHVTGASRLHPSNHNRLAMDC